MIEVFILSLIQGVTEFLPISSSSHLIIISDYFKFNNQSLSIDISLHIGSFFAVITYFRNSFYIKSDINLYMSSSDFPEFNILLTLARKSLARLESDSESDWFWQTKHLRFSIITSASANPSSDWPLRGRASPAIL